MQPAFSLTFLSSHGPESEPSSFQERRTCYKMLIQLLHLLPPPPGFLEDIFDIWTMETAHFSVLFLFTSLQLHIVISLHISPSMRTANTLPHFPYAHIYPIFLSPHHLFLFHFALSFSATRFFFSRELAQGTHFSAFFL